MPRSSSSAFPSHPFFELRGAVKLCVTFPKDYPKPRVFMRSDLQVSSQAALGITISYQSECDTSPLPPNPSPGDCVEPPLLAIWAPRTNGQLEGQGIILTRQEASLVLRLPPRTSPSTLWGPSLALQSINFTLRTYIYYINS